MIDMFGILATPLAYIMRFIYNFLSNYGWTIIVFTILVRILMIPLSLMQQKSTARMGAYQPFIQEIQKKWAGDKNRQSQELQKFYSDNKIKMTGGCLPMLVNMLVLFGIIGVIQAPLHYMVGVPNDQIESAFVITAQNRDDISLEKRNNYTLQSVLIGEIKNNPQMFIDGVTGEDGNTVKVEEKWVTAVQNFNFEFLGINLSQRPSLDFNIYLIFPILSVLTMFASQIIIMKTSGTAMAGQGKNTMLIMTLVMGVMFGYYAFIIPVGFSLYYTISNIVMTVQQLILRKIYDPKKIQEQIRQDLEEKRQMKKAKKVVTVKDKKGEVIIKEMSDSEIARLRLEKARQLDAEIYSENAGEDKNTAQNKKENKPELNIEKSEDNYSEEGDEEQDQSQEESQKQNDEEKADTEKEEYRPGRRKRARLKKEGGMDEEDLSFAEKEMNAEKNNNAEEER